MFLEKHIFEGLYQIIASSFYHDHSVFFQMPILSTPSHPVYFNLSYLRLNLPHQLQRSQTVVPEASCECHCSKAVTTAYPDWGEGKLA